MGLLDIFKRGDESSISKSIADLEKRESALVQQITKADNLLTGPGGADNALAALDGDKAAGSTIDKARADKAQAEAELQRVRAGLGSLRQRLNELQAKARKEAKQKKIDAFNALVDERIAAAREVESALVALVKPLQKMEELAPQIVQGYTGLVDKSLHEGSLFRHTYRNIEGSEAPHVMRCLLKLGIVHHFQGYSPNFLDHGGEMLGEACTAQMDKYRLDEDCVPDDIRRANEATAREAADWEAAQAQAEAEAKDGDQAEGDDQGKGVPVDPDVLEAARTPRQTQALTD